jgi:DNA-binding MarR family transcriptional regulator
VLLLAFGIIILLFLISLSYYFKSNDPILKSLGLGYFTFIFSTLFAFLVYSDVLFPALISLSLLYFFTSISNSFFLNGFYKIFYIRYQIIKDLILGFLILNPISMLAISLLMPAATFPHELMLPEYSIYFIIYQFVFIGLVYMVILYLIIYFFVSTSVVMDDLTRSASKYIVLSFLILIIPILFRIIIGPFVSGDIYIFMTIFVFFTALFSFVLLLIPLPNIHLVNFYDAIIKASIVKKALIVTGIENLNEEIIKQIFTAIQTQNIRDLQNLELNLILSGKELSTMFIIAKVYPKSVTLSEIQKNLDIPKSTTKFSLDRLLQQNLIEKFPNPKDGRKENIVLTIKGLLFLGNYKKQFDDIRKT